MNEFHVHADAEAVAQAAADFLQQEIRRCVREHGDCHVVLPGGSTPARCLELLADRDLPWRDIHWYPGDERCLPVGDAERNDTMIAAKLSGMPDRPLENLHSIPAESGPDAGAQSYARQLENVRRFDLVVLGMGEDGHTASLFPGNAALADTSAAVPVRDAPKPPAERVSIGLARLRDAALKIVLATGGGKHDALDRVRNGEFLPVGQVAPHHWFVDEAAYGT